MALKGSGTLPPKVSARSRQTPYECFQDFSDPETNFLN
jgi:hypothetical protein